MALDPEDSEDHLENRAPLDHRARPVATDRLDPLVAEETAVNVESPDLRASPAGTVLLASLDPPEPLETSENLDLRVNRVREGLWVAQDPEDLPVFLDLTDSPATKENKDPPDQQVEPAPKAQSDLPESREHLDQMEGKCATASA